MNTIEHRVHAHSKPILEALGYILVDVEYQKEGSDYYLRLFIDKKGGITIDDCARASEALTSEIDDLDIIPGAYFLDVSSPGAERPIETDADLETTVNNGIYVKTYEQIDAEKEWTGTLLRYDAEIVVVEYKDKAKTKTVDIPRAKIATIRKAVLL